MNVLACFHGGFRGEPGDRGLRYEQRARFQSAVLSGRREDALIVRPHHQEANTTVLCSWNAITWACRV